jgi:hypothetical protein
MTTTGKIGRKFSIRMSSDGIIEENFASIILFYGEIFSVICFYVRKQLFRFILQKFDTFPKTGYATNAFLLKEIIHYLI